MCESVSFFDGFGFKENFIPDNKVRVLKTYELKNLFFVKQLRQKWIETRISRIHTNWISRIRDSSWNSCQAFVYFMSTRESQQSDNATRFRYRRESQRYWQFPRAIMIDSFAEIDGRPAKRRFRSSRVAPQHPPATAPPARLPAID